MAKTNDTTLVINPGPASFSANRWLDAHVTGNGKVGLAMLGAYANEGILVNHGDLKHGGYSGVLQDVSDKFPTVRKLFNETKIHETEKVLSAEFARKGCKPKPDQPLPLAIIGIDFENGGMVTDYKRITDMKSGELSVKFKQGGTSTERKLFASRTADLICYNVSKNGPDKINVTLSIRPVGELPQNAVIKYEGGFMYFAARGTNGFDYGLVARVITATGLPEHRGNGLAFKNADGFSLFAKVFVNSNRDTEFKKIKNELLEIRSSYDKLLSSHESAHKKLYEESTLDLVAADTNEFIMKLERSWNFAKYLLVCTNGTVLTPAGLWCGDDKTQNGFLSFGNTAQLLYSGVTANLMPNHILSLFEYFEKYVDDLKKNAARVFGAKGYFVPNCTSPDSALFGLVDEKTLHFVASSALAANLFYKYYQATGDVKTLKSRIFPFMREVFNFYSDFLKLDSSGFYSTVPSYSPESTPGNIIAGKPLENFAFASNSTIDFLALAVLLNNLVEAAAACGANQTEIPLWNEMLLKIPKFSVSDNGSIREYTNSVFIDGTFNRGCMHTYGLFPLKNFSFTDTTVTYRPTVTTGSQANQTPVISLKKASANAIHTRLAKASSLQNAQTLAMYAAQLANAEAPEAVQNLLGKLLSVCVTSGGLCVTNDWRGSGFTTNAPASLDIAGNLGIATAVTECLVQSDSKTLRILPAVFEGLQEGRLSDIATDFGARISVEWDIRRGRCIIKINPKVTCKINIMMPGAFKRPKAKEIPFDPNTNTIKDLSLTAGKLAVIEF